MRGRIINAKYGAHNYIIKRMRDATTGESNFSRESEIFFMDAE